MLSLRSFGDLNAAIAKGIHLVDPKRYDVIVGVPRSGMLPASIMATMLQLPLGDVGSIAHGFYHGRSGRIERVTGRERVLLVDDTSNKGGAMARAVALVKPHVGRVTRLAVYGPYQVADPARIIDIVFETVQGPRVFQWNLWKHKRMERWAFDFDGVFCRDPSRQENDDGRLYATFMETAPALHLPTRPIGHVVTGRLEKWRTCTEDQLARYGIEYQSLTMMPYATKAERMAVGGRGQWKAEVAGQLGVELFVESDPKQASIIARRTGLPVWCTSNATAYRDQVEMVADAA